MSRVWEVLVSLLLWARDCTSFLWKNVITPLTLEREVHHDEQVCYLQCTGCAGTKLRWLSINTTDYKEAKKLFVSAGQDIVAYLEYKFYEDYEEALARGVPLVEDGEELSEHQFFDAQLHSITEFKDFDKDEWRAARYLIDCYEEEIMKHQRAKKKRAVHGNNRQKRT
jgi:hypothetical protein